MRYMVFGDVHGNLVALETALAAAQRLGAEAYLFVGDLIGYGPEPLECIERLLALQQEGKLAWVVGNHELVVRGELDSEGYNEEAMQTLNWTRELVDSTPWAKEFIASGNLTVQVDELIWLAHDSLASPSNGHYHRYPQNAKSELACLRYYGGRVCFYGHTHSMRAELLREGEVVLVPMETHEPEDVDPKPLLLPAQELGWIGAGSTGFPTSQGRRAEFLILDDSEGDDWKIEKYAATYSREEARERALRILTETCSTAVAEHVSRWL
ncbi:MAG: metallophosphoesterase family protein [Verrucomicrobiia bacterium]|jgi:predicted phosphodiesterase